MILLQTHTLWQLSQVRTLVLPRLYRSPFCCCHTDIFFFEKRLHRLPHNQHAIILFEWLHTHLFQLLELIVTLRCVPLRCMDRGDGALATEIWGTESSLCTAWMGDINSKGRWCAGYSEIYSIHKSSSNGPRLRSRASRRVIRLASTHILCGLEPLTSSRRRYKRSRGLGGVGGRAAFADMARCVSIVRVDGPSVWDDVRVGTGLFLLGTLAPTRVFCWSGCTTFSALRRRFCWGVLARFKRMGHPNM